MLQLSNHLWVRLHTQRSKSLVLQETKERIENIALHSPSLQHNIHHILWLPANLAKDRHEIKTANKTSCCHCLLPGHHPNQLWQGLAPPPRLAVIWVVVDHYCRLSVLATTALFTKEISFHVPSRHLSYDYGFQFRTCSEKHCSHSLTFIFSCLLIFRHKPIARWSTLTKPCGRKSNHWN